MDDATGDKVGEIAVLTSNTALQYKHGGSAAKNIIKQITQKTEPFINIPAIGLIKGANWTMRAALRTVENAGPHIMVQHDINLLINTIK